MSYVMQCDVCKKVIEPEEVFFYLGIEICYAGDVVFTTKDEDNEDDDEYGNGTHACSKECAANFLQGVVVRVQKVKKA
jgi:hypothetical protein